MKYVACKDFESTIAIDGSTCITTMRELYMALADKETTELFIKHGFANEYFTPSSLSQFLRDAKKVNPHANIYTDAVSVDFMVDQVKRLHTLRSKEELIYALEKNPKEIFDTITELCQFYTSAYSETLEANNKVSTQHLKIASLQKQLDEKNAAYEELSIREQETAKRLHILVSRINYQYEHNLNMDTLVDAVGNRYDKILYIKEISRVHFTDTLIYYLQEIMRTLYGVPCRFCVMEPFYAYQNAALYPDLKRSWDMTANDVCNADIYMAGYQPTLVEDILKNPSNVRYLIVLDRAGGFDVHVHGENVEVLYCVSDVNDIANFKHMDRIISYSTGTLNIPYVPEFDAKTNEEKVSLYSSMPVMKAIIDLMERR